MVRWVDVEAAEAVEMFLGFLPAKQAGTAKVLTDTVLNYLRHITLDPKRGPNKLKLCATRWSSRINSVRINSIW